MLCLLEAYTSFVAKRDGDLLIRIFLTQGQKKNDYSELVFFDENEEIFGSVFPKFGRTVIWNDTADFIFKPPSMQKMSGEYSLFIKATLDKTKVKKSVNQFKVCASAFIVYPFLKLSCVDLA